MAGFVYNPAESIRQDFQQAQSGLGNIFAQIIQQKQRDYTLAENTFANIEALKKDVNIYGQKSISSKANNLLGHASSAILSNGKLDFDKLGEIRQAVSDIKDLKTGYDLAAKEYEKALQLGIGSKEDLLSFQKYYSDLGGVMSDENLIKNPRDLQVAFSKVYTNNLDGSKKFVNTFKTIAPYSPIKKQITNTKGGITDIEADIPKNWVVGEDGRVSMPKTITLTNPDGTTREVSYLSQITAELKAKDPTLIPLLREQSGFETADLSDEQIAEYFLNNQVKVGVSAKETKSKNQIAAEEAEAKTKTFTAEHQGELFNAQINQIKAGTRAQNVNTQKTLAEIKLYSQPRSLADYQALGIQFNPNGTVRYNLGGGIPMDLVKKDNTTMKVIASEIFTKPNGTKYLKYYVPNPSKDIEEQIRTGLQGATAKEIILPDDFVNSETFSNLKSAAMGYKTGKKAAIANALNYLPSAISSYSQGSQPVSGTIDGNTIYLDSSLKSQEQAIKSKYGVTNVVYIN